MHLPFPLFCQTTLHQGCGDSPRAKSAESSSEYPYRQTANECESAVAWLSAVLSLCFPPGHRQIERAHKARRDQGLQHKHVCLQSGVSGTEAGGLGHQAVCCGCLIAFRRTADRDDLDNLNTFTEALNSSSEAL